jgi:hypothetical protein
VIILDVITTRGENRPFSHTYDNYIAFCGNTNSYITNGARNKNCQKCESNTGPVNYYKINNNNK